MKHNSQLEARYLNPPASLTALSHRTLPAVALLEDTNELILSGTTQSISALSGDSLLPSTSADGHPPNDGIAEG